jgi:hypothetical protein
MGEERPQTPSQLVPNRTESLQTSYAAVLRMSFMSLSIDWVN